MVDPSQVIKRILFVDDDPFYARNYEEELGEHFDVEYYMTATEAVRAIKELREATLIVMDVMMPPPSVEHIADTENGHTTGLWILEVCKESVARWSCPVVLLTNVDVEQIAARLERRGLSDLNYIVVGKSSCTVEQFAKRAIEFVKTFSEDGGCNG